MINYELHLIKNNEIVDVLGFFELEKESITYRDSYLSLHPEVDGDEILLYSIILEEYV